MTGPFVQFPPETIVQEVVLFQEDIEINPKAGQYFYFALRLVS